MKRKSLLCTLCWTLLDAVLFCGYFKIHLFELIPLRCSFYIPPYREGGLTHWWGQAPTIAIAHTLYFGLMSTTFKFSR